MEILGLILNVLTQQHNKNKKKMNKAQERKQKRDNLKKSLLNKEYQKQNKIPKESIMDLLTCNEDKFVNIIDDLAIKDSSSAIKLAQMRAEYSDNHDFAHKLSSVTHLTLCKEQYKQDGYPELAASLSSVEYVGDGQYLSVFSKNG